MSSEDTKPTEQTVEETTKPEDTTQAESAPQVGPKIQTSFLFKEGGTMHEVDSMCMNCHGQGTTKMLLTRIPKFKDVVVTSFSCPTCHYKESGVQNTTEIAPHAITYELLVDVMNNTPEEVHADLNRQVVRADTAIIRIPELQFEIDANRGEINTVEGVLRNIKESLIAGQEERLEKQPDAHAKLEDFIRRIEMMEEGKETFTLVVDDVAGNSFVENPYAPRRDPRCKVIKRMRTRQETVALGFKAPPDAEDEHSSSSSTAHGDINETNETKSNIHYGPDGKIMARPEGYKTGGSKAALNVMSQTMLNKKPLDRFDAIVATRDLRTATFHGQCHSCGNANETRMCIFDVPYFRETIIMCTDCTKCGFRDAEVKPGGGVSETGLRIELSVTTTEDLSRDVLKSDHAAIYLPGLDLEMMHGTLGGKFTTVEGVLLNIRDQLLGSKAYYEGDSASEETKKDFEEVLRRLDSYINVTEPYTFTLDDPAGLSFVEGRANGVPDSDPYQDTMMKITSYKRTEEQNESLGFAGMNTENYYSSAEAIPEGNEEKGSDDSDDDSDSDSDSDSSDNDEKEEEASSSTSAEAAPAAGDAGKNAGDAK